MADTRDLKISPATAIVLDAMLRRPRAEHYAGGIAAATEQAVSVVRANLQRLNTAGWCSVRREMHNPRGRNPRTLYQLTPAGRIAATREIKQWDISHA